MKRIFTLTIFLLFALSGWVNESMASCSSCTGEADVLIETSDENTQSITKGRTCSNCVDNRGWISIAGTDMYVDRNYDASSIPCGFTSDAYRFYVHDIASDGVGGVGVYDVMSFSDLETFAVEYYFYLDNLSGLSSGEAIDILRFRDDGTDEMYFRVRNDSGSINLYIIVNGSTVSVGGLSTDTAYRIELKGDMTQTGSNDTWGARLFSWNSGTSTWDSVTLSASSGTLDWTHSDGLDYVRMGIMGAIYLNDGDSIIMDCLQISSSNDFIDEVTPPDSWSDRESADPLTYPYAFYNSNGDLISPVNSTTLLQAEYALVGDADDDGSLEWKDIITTWLLLCDADSDDSQDDKMTDLDGDGQADDYYCGICQIPDGTWNSDPAISSSDIYSSTLYLGDFQGYTLQGESETGTILNLNVSRTDYCANAGDHPQGLRHGGGIRVKNSPGYITFQDFTIDGIKEPRYHWGSKGDCDQDGHEYEDPDNQGTAQYNDRRYQRGIRIQNSADSAGSDITIQRITVPHSDYGAVSVYGYDYVTMDDINIAPNYGDYYGQLGVELSDSRHSTITNIHGGYGMTGHRESVLVSVASASSDEAFTQTTDDITISGITSDQIRGGISIVAGGHDTQNITVSDFTFFGHGMSQLDWPGTWSNESGNVYKTDVYFDDVAVAYEPDGVSWYNGSNGTWQWLTENDGNYATLRSGQWDWDSNVLYVNIGGDDPDRNNHIIKLQWGTQVSSGGNYGIRLHEINYGGDAGLIKNISISNGSVKGFWGEGYSFSYRGDTTTDRNITITDVDFEGNNQNDEGDADGRDSTFVYPFYTISGCTFTGVDATDGDGDGIPANLDADDSGDGDYDLSELIYISFWDSSNILSDSTFSGAVQNSGNDAFIIVRQGGGIIQGSTFIGPSDGYMKHIYLDNADDGIIIESNLFNNSANTDGIGIIFSSLDNAIMRYNRFLGGYVGIYASSGDNDYIYYNICDDPDDYAIYSISADNLKIYNNDLFDVTTAIRVDSGSATPTIQNNIAWDVTNFLYNNGATITGGYNYSSGGIYGGGSYTDTNSSDILSSGVDPFIDYSGGDYTILTDSPAKTTGTDVWTGTANVLDITGNAITDAAGTLTSKVGKYGISAGAYQ